MIPRRWMPLGAALLATAAIALVPLLPSPTAGAQEARVRAVMFYDPSCHNCEAVQEEVLPELEEAYGERFELVQVDAATVPGMDLWSAATRLREIPEEERGVPLLLIGQETLTGQDQIRQRLAYEIDRGLEAGGLDLPEDVALSEDDVAFWAEHLAALNPTLMGPDPVANALALIVLLGMAASLVAVGPRVGRARHLLQGAKAPVPHGWTHYAVPALSLAGLGVAGYLSWAKWTSSSAICPIGNCEAVQHSPYAQLLGVPVAYLGLVSYLALLGLWLAGELGAGDRATRAAAALFLLAGFGTLFSAYLTFLEPFVIKEVCIWCLASAVLMTGVLLASARQIGVPSRRTAKARARRKRR